MLDVLDTKRGDRAYFNALWQQMENGGGAAMLHELLLQRDISNFDVREVPQTTALGTQKMLTLQDLDAWWLEVLKRGYVFLQEQDRQPGLQRVAGVLYDRAAVQILSAVGRSP